MREQLRLYCFQSMYLSGIQAGIQSQHSTAELFVKYNPSKSMFDLGKTVGSMVEHLDKTDLLYDWAEKHKTTIVLNGGYASNLKRLEEFLSSEDNPYPWSSFRESEEALEGVLTNVCIVVPEKVWDFDVDIHRHEYVGDFIREHTGRYALSNFEFELAKEIKQCRLMN